MDYNENTIRILISVVTTVFTLPIGIYLGHFLALGRDKRKEYKSLVDPIRLKLIKGIEVQQEEIYELEARIGNKVSSIKNVYTDTYQPAMKLDINSGPYDNSGNIITVDEQQIAQNKAIREEALLALLDACKHK
tara:strand:+ start:624 stop:1025 length:402 start_codon:yes stop_codon:yes gene_type:complete